jgi:hypothetical protein
MANRGYCYTKRPTKPLNSVRQVANVRVASQHDRIVIVMIPDCLTLYNVEATESYLRDTHMHVLQWSIDCYALIQLDVYIPRVPA